MSSRSQQVITESAVRTLNTAIDKPVIWKELGAYLDKRLEVSSKPSSSTKSALITASAGESYLRTNIKFKICTTCNRPVGEKNLAQHYRKCIEMSKQTPAASAAHGIKRKKGKNLMDPETSSLDSSRNSTPAPSSQTRPKKKYKKSQTQKEKEAANAAAANAASVGSSPVKKEDSTAPATATTAKKKKALKPKSVAKTKGPVDVEKQCGVPLPSGGFCARSLTCKTHSMGAKRAVLGRSAPYDALLQQYQKRNQAKLAASNALAAQRRENAELDPADEEAASRVFDPDEETHLVLEGLSKNNPMPLERKVILPVRNRYRFLSSREFYANAMIMGIGNSNSNSTSSSGDQTLANQAISGSIGGLQGRCALVNVDSVPQGTDSVTQSFSAIPGEMYQVRAPSKAILMTAQSNAMQQQAFQQQVMKMQKQQMMKRQKA